MVESADSVLLCAAGDVALGGAIEEALDFAQSRAALIAGVRDLFANADLRFVNLDCTFDTTGPPPHPEEYLVHGDPRHLILLAELGVDLLSLANNHGMDYGGASLLATRDHVMRLGIRTVGAGVDLNEAGAGTVLVRHGRRVGFLAYASEHPWVGAIPAGPGAPGVAPIDPERMNEAIARLRREVDHVVVSVHWGKESLHYPPPAVLDLGRRLVDQGADLVIGHHPHVVQGIEVSGRGVILFSLGNLLYPDYPEQRLSFAGPQRESLVVLVRLSSAGAEVAELVPVAMAADGCLARLSEPRRSEALTEVERYSAVFPRADYPAFWQAQVRRAEVRRLWRVLDEEVLNAGWRGGACRLARLGRKNFRSIGRSLAEILGRGAGGGRP
ncbi:MAG: CapA family protein [Candidatus Latescibacterota bacterium]|jgi:poly-gamma-glutamate synthesis protein (capsule biosynthesis protein)